jgi:2-keto-4-pentenoate hydratase/2-oxohepta-3-ene-1,7-dioic acid hydratase in catechol pathway
MFHAMFEDGERFHFPLTKVVCVGRNYAEHALELNNPVPETPILFIKPESSVVDLHAPLIIPSSDCHYETEVAILMGAEISDAPVEFIPEAIAGVGLALDLTRRALQSQLKSNSHPWEIAKSFDGACPISRFIRGDEFSDLNSLSFSLAINGEEKQAGNTSDMLTPILPLISYISRFFTLRPGDVVLTGTPKGVGQLHAGDVLRLQLADMLVVETHAQVTQS